MASDRPGLDSELYFLLLTSVPCLRHGHASFEMGYSSPSSPLPPSLSLRFSSLPLNMAGNTCSSQRDCIYFTKVLLGNKVVAANWCGKEPAGRLLGLMSASEANPLLYPSSHTCSSDLSGVSIKKKGFRKLQRPLSVECLCFLCFM